MTKKENSIQRTTGHDTARRAALIMLQAGLANLSEVAALAGVKRQAAAYWAEAAGLDDKKVSSKGKDVPIWQARREAYLAKVWREAIAEAKASKK